jgi:RES domain-containing protein
LRQSNLKLWRVVTRQRAEGAFNGEGSVLYSGRWHSKGTRLVYTADSLSSAILETTVHMNATTMYLEYVYFCVTVPDDVEIDEIDRSTLNSDWSNISAPGYLKEYGDNWIEKGETAILCVPSAIVPVENNYLIDPIHPDFQSIVISPAETCSIDPRIKSL